MKLPMARNSKLVLALSFTVALAGCGGGGGSGQKLPTSINAIAVDGLLSGMFCYADVNRNGVYNPGTDYASESLTNNLGEFYISGVNVEEYPKICRAEANSIDTATNEPYIGQLTAPPGSQAVSPVTTLIQNLGGNASAEQTVRNLLGIDGSVDLKANPLSNPNLAKATAKVQSIISAITQSLVTQTGSSSVAQKNAIAKAAFEALAASASAGNNVLSDQSALVNVINSVTQTVTTSTTNPAASEIAASVSSLLTNVDSQYDSVIAKGSTFTADDLNQAQSNSISNDSINTAFSTNSVNLVSGSLPLNPNLVVDNSTSNATSPTKVLYSSQGNDNQDPETFQGTNPLSDFGSGSQFAADFAGDASYPRVFEVQSGEGYGAGVHVALAAFLNYSVGFSNGYDTFNAKVKGSPSGNIEVKFFGDNSSESAAVINLNSYSGATNLGNGWFSITIPFKDFTNSTQSNFENHSGWLIGPPGDQGDSAFNFYFTDVELSFENSGFTEPVSGSDRSDEKLLYSKTSGSEDDPETFTSLDTFGNGATFDANVTTDASFSRVFSVTSGEGYGSGVHVAFAAFTGYSAGFAEGYDTFNAKVKGSPDGTIEVKLIGGLSDSEVIINVNSYSGSTSLGNGWFEISIPFSEFSNNSAQNIAAHTGWLIGPPGDQADETFVFFFTDISFSGYTAPPPVEKSYQLVWSNEFDSNDLSNWNIETGYGPNNDGWGNDESQLYTNSADNITVSNGNLVITAKCDLTINGTCNKRDGTITSARITTNDLVEFRYGKVEARIQVPAGSSTWPAFWMLGADFPNTPWPNVGEIDIMEVWQTGSSSINQSNSTIHYNDGGQQSESGNTTLTEALSSGFKVWTMEWDESSISFAIDGTTYFTVDTTNSKYDAFRNSFFLLLNVAIDGTLGGAPNEINSTPQVMLVDYVRVYQDSNNANNLFTETAPSTSNSLISNGDFSSSTDAWSGNAFNVVNGENFANVTSAGDAFAVNLSNVVELTPGQTYTLTFDAKGTDGRTMIAGLGLNESPFTSATQVVTLGTDYQTYTYTFENIGFGGANSRILFDMGADTGEVFIDNVSLIAGYPNLIENGDFSSTTAAWTGNAFNVVNGENVANVATAGDAFAVNISNEVALTAGQTYALTFDAKGRDGRTMIAGIGQSVAPFAAATETVTLGTSFKTYTLYFENISFGEADNRVLFDMGADTGEVVIDNVSLKKAKPNLLQNGDFSSSSTAWSGNAFNVINGENFANVTTAGDAFAVNLSNVLSLTAGQTYTLSFDAKGTNGRTMLAGIGLNESPFTAATQQVTLSSEYQTFTYIFFNIGFGSANSRVLFDMGADTGDVFIDNVRLTN